MADFYFVSILEVCILIISLQLQSWGFGRQPAGQGCIQTTKL